MQSLVCSLSLINRALDKEEVESGDDRVKEDKKEETSGGLCLPLRQLNHPEIIFKVWSLLQTIPSSLQQYLLPPCATTMTTASSSSNCSSNTAIAEQCRVAITQMRRLLEVTPPGLNALRVLILAIRDIVLSIEHLSTPLARLKLLADVLLLWVNTNNFSMVNPFQPVTSDPVNVVARELGSVVIKSVIERGNQSVARDGDRATTSGLNKRKRTVEKGSLSLIEKSFQEEEKRSSVEPPSSSSSPSPLSDDSPSPTLEGIINENATNNQDALSVCSETATTISASSVSSLCSSLLECKNGAGGTATHNSNIELKASEQVYTGCKVYGPTFIFWQVMAWFSAASDQREVQQ